MDSVPIWRRGVPGYGGQPWRIVFVLLIGVSLVVLFAPESQVPSGLPEGIDKVVHFTLFGALCGSGVFAGVRPRWLILGLVTYAITSEVIQASPILGRSASGWDVLADVTGIAVALMLALAGARRSRGTS